MLNEISQKEKNNGYITHMLHRETKQRNKLNQINPRNLTVKLIIQKEKVGLGGKWGGGQWL